MAKRAKRSPVWTDIGQVAGVAVSSLYAYILIWARRQSKLVPKLALNIDCSMVREQRRKGDRRAFMHVNHVPGKLCVAHEVASLSPGHVVGLFLHELGHPIAYKLWRRSEQEDADAAVRQELGVTILYRGPLVLQWVPPKFAKAMTAFAKP